MPDRLGRRACDVAHGAARRVCEPDRGGDLRQVPIGRSADASRIWIGVAADRCLCAQSARGRERDYLATKRFGSLARQLPQRKVKA